MGDHIFSLPSYTGVNSTYRLEFRAPLLRCNTTTTREERILEVGDFGVYIPGFVSTWYNDPTKLSFKKHFVDSIYQISTTEKRPYWTPWGLERRWKRHSCAFMKGSPISPVLEIIRLTTVRLLSFATGPVEPRTTVSSSSFLLHACTHT
jgi:hypothetical protein